MMELQQNAQISTQADKVKGNYGADGSKGWLQLNSANSICLYLTKKLQTLK